MSSRDDMKSALAAWLAPADVHRYVNSPTDVSRLAVLGPVLALSLIGLGQGAGPALVTAVRSILGDSWFQLTALPLL